MLEISIDILTPLSVGRTGWRSPLWHLRCLRWAWDKFLSWSRERIGWCRQVWESHWSEVFSRIWYVQWWRWDRLRQVRNHIWNSWISSSLHSSRRTHIFEVKVHFRVHWYILDVVNVFQSDVVEVVECWRLNDRCLADWIGDGWDWDGHHWRRDEEVILLLVLAVLAVLTVLVWISLGVKGLVGTSERIIMEVRCNWIGVSVVDWIWICLVLRIIRTELIGTKLVVTELVGAKLVWTELVRIVIWIRYIYRVVHWVVYWHWWSVHGVVRELMDFINFFKGNIVSLAHFEEVGIDLERCWFHSEALLYLWIDHAVVDWNSLSTEKAQHQLSKLVKREQP